MTLGVANAATTGSYTLNLPTGIAHFRTQMLPMQHEQYISRNAAQSEEEGHGRLFEVIRQMRGGFEVGILQDVLRIDASL